MLSKSGYSKLEVADDKEHGIALYQKGDSRLIVSYKLPTRIITGLQGDQLNVDTQKVADLQSSPALWENDKRFSKFKLQAVVDDDNIVRAYTVAQEGIYTPVPLLGSHSRSLSFFHKIKDKSFFESLPPEVANMRLTNGDPILFQYLGSFETDRLEYLLKNDADPNLRSWNGGNTALHKVHNLKAAQLLVKMGADLNRVNSEGQTPFETAPTDELKAFLDPNKPTPTPTPDVSPSGSPSPSPSPDPTPGSPSPSPSPS